TDRTSARNSLASAARNRRLSPSSLNMQPCLKFMDFMQPPPRHVFTVVQIGLNAVAILGGIVGDAAFSPAFSALFSHYMSPELSE
ncbi:hypothetical protein ONQ62_25820, partial [Salmonella enterica subsp. enterica serovar Virginia]|nr:hypothetical protein [Salmonella enterica subsp. enterica serovar Virginia]